MNNTSMVNKDNLEFDPSIPEDERRFYLKAYPNVNFVRERKVHCTICKMHIGTAPSNESIIRMHPILRVTHCKKCHEFYNSGEFSKGEDGSELYCRWCGQGGEVYCCSNCPFVFCKSCIISNLSRGVVADIEQNENWSCFNCAPKMLWPLRAQHWALMKFIDKQKKAILNSNLSDAEIKTQMTKDRSLCCKIKKTSGYGTDSSDSSDISLSRLKQKVGEKRSRKSMSKEDLSMPGASPSQAKKTKGNNEVVCTPDVMSMLEPECTITEQPNAKATPQPAASTPKIMSITQPTKQITPPPLLIRSSQSPQLRPQAPTPVLKKTIVGPRLPSTPGTDFSTPVYHTINGFRIDLNSAAQQETVRLPNGKLIQVKRQGTGPQQVTTVQNAPNINATPTRVIHTPTPPPLSSMGTVPGQQIVHSSGGHIIRTQLQTPRSITVQNPTIIPHFQQQTSQQYQQITIRQPNQQIATIRYQGNAASQQQVTNMLQNGTMQLINGTPITTTTPGQIPTVRQVPTFIKQFFPNTPLGQSRTQLQNQIFSAMEICQHLMGKVQTLTNSNAYKTAKSLTDVKELYIHLSYLLTYAIGRFKGLQDSCLSDMRDLGFTNDANSLENGQLAAEKQASDAEEDEITIVEPKTDTINLDSDNEDDQPPIPNKTNSNTTVTPPCQTVIKNNSNVVTNPVVTPVVKQVNPVVNNVVNTNVMNVPTNQTQVINPTTTTNADDEITAEYDFSKVASLLAGMLEIELTEGGNESVQPPKKPRKKTTNKPNPTLLKQKEIQERERLENLKKNDTKLKMLVTIPLNKVEDIYEYAKPLVEELKHSKVSKLESDSVKSDVALPEGNVLEKKEEKNEMIELKQKDIDDKDETKEIQEKKINHDKDEPEEVVVVVVEDMDSSKGEEQKATGDDNETVEIIEQEESQESTPDSTQKEESPCSKDETKKDLCTDQEVEEEVKEGDKSEEKEVDKDETHFDYKVNEGNEEDKDEELLEELENKGGSPKIPSTKELDLNDIKESDAADPLQDEEDSSLSVPKETKNSEEDVDNNLDTNNLSHNNDYKSIMGRTEVA